MSMSEGVTVDALLGGRVTLLQPARGFRVSLDPVLLTGFVAAPFGRFLDIGCGVGAVSFLLLARDAGATGVAVEIQPELAGLAEEGRARNGWDARLAIRRGDVRALDLPGGAFDLVVTNPPFRPVAGGHLSPDPSRAMANHEVTLALAEWADVAARAVRPGGRVAAIFPADRAADLCSTLKARGLAPARLRMVHPHADRPATRALVEAARGEATLVVEAPLIVHAEAGSGERFTPEVSRMLAAPQ
jgi:tRNA1(Val) A37 N6-methylase TrmN6